MSQDVHTISQLAGSNFNRQDRVFMGKFAVNTPASASAVTALGTITPGSGFTGIGTVTLAPSGGTGSGLTAVATSLKAVSATVVAQGASGFAVNDTITLANGVVLTVSAVTSGKPTAATVTTAGAFTGPVAPNPVAQTATSGSGVGTTTWTLSYGIGTAQITNSGNYTAAPSMTATDTAGGTGASIATGTLGGNGSAVYVSVVTQMPPAYAVLVEPALDCRHYVPAALKTTAGFTVALVPTTTGSTLAAGSVDVLVTA